MIRWLAPLSGDQSIKVCREQFLLRFSFDQSKYPIFKWCSLVFAKSAMRSSEKLLGKTLLSRYCSSVHDQLIRSSTVGWASSRKSCSTLPCASTSRSYLKIRCIRMLSTSSVLSSFTCLSVRLSPRLMVRGTCCWTMMSCVCSSWLNALKNCLFWVNVFEQSLQQCFVVLPTRWDGFFPQIPSVAGQTSHSPRLLLQRSSYCWAKW